MQADFMPPSVARVKCYHAKGNRAGAASLWALPHYLCTLYPSNNQLGLIGSEETGCADREAENGASLAQVLECRATAKVRAMQQLLGTHLHPNTALILHNNQLLMSDGEESVDVALPPEMRPPRPVCSKRV